MNNQPHHGAPFDRERERELEEQRHRAIQQQDDLAHREREREREQNERHQRETYQPGAPHHSTAGSIPIHQPVASRISGVIHSPGGLLANHGGAAPISLGPPSGPVASFGGPLHGGDSKRPLPHAAPSSTSTAQQHMFAPMPHGSVAPSNSLGAPSGPPVFGGPLQPEPGRAGQQPPFAGGMPGPHANPAGPGGLTQGQQPILNVRIVTFVCHHGP